TKGRWPNSLEKSCRRTVSHTHLLTLSLCCENVPGCSSVPAVTVSCTRASANSWSHRLSSRATSETNLGNVSTGCGFSKSAITTAGRPYCSSGQVSPVLLICRILSTARWRFPGKPTFSLRTDFFMIRSVGFQSNGQRRLQLGCLIEETFLKLMRRLSLPGRQC